MNMLRLEVRLVVLLATLALFVLLVIEWKVDGGGGSDQIRRVSLTKQVSFPSSLSRSVLEKTDYENTPLRERQKGWYTYEPLPNNVVSAIDRFVFFVGYARSGHSIIASMLDAHPNVVIAHEYALFSRWLEHPDLYNRQKASLFNTLYNSSRYSAQNGLRQGVTKKGYSLEVPGWFQGTYEGGITVIGDKAGGMTAQVYRKNRAGFLSVYKQLQSTTMVPVHAIHVIRNPYDNIATMLLYNEHVKNKVNESFKYNNVEALNKQVRAYFSQVESVLSLIETIGLNVITIHHSDFIANPKATMRRLCNTFSLTCSERYLHAVAEHTYMTESHSRHLVTWTPELLNLVARNMAKYPLFKSYKFR